MNIMYVLLSHSRTQFWENMKACMLSIKVGMMRVEVVGFSFLMV